MQTVRPETTRAASCLERYWACVLLYADIRQHGKVCNIQSELHVIDTANNVFRVATVLPYQDCMLL